MSTPKDINNRGMKDSEYHNQNQFSAVDVKQETQDHSVGCATNVRECKRSRNSNDSTLEKLKRFFESVQKKHPESQLELQYVEGNWRVWCGICKKLLRPDKSGKAIHNIQRQHFSCSRHKKKLHLMLEEAEKQKKKQ